MRGLAALYVVFVHFCTMVDPLRIEGGKSRAPEWLQMLMTPLLYGHLAVAAFIVMSGFCLQLALFEQKNGYLQNLPKFLKRRALRILPTYYACLALSILTAIWITPIGAGKPFDQYLPLSWPNVLTHLLLIHNFFPEYMYKINGVLWSIALEAQLYLVFPILVALLMRGGRWLAVLATGCAAAFLVVRFPELIRFRVWYVPLFMLGMAAAHAAYRPNLFLGVRPRLGAALGVGGLCMALAVRFKLPLSLSIAYPICDALIGLSAAGLAYLSAVHPYHRFNRWLGAWPLVLLGTFSYSLYLMHHPFEQALYLFRPAFVQGAVAEFFYLVGIGLPCILIGSYVFHCLFERPFMRNRPIWRPASEEQRKAEYGAAPS